jgi:ubiquinone/menaquinone biosynthesis C-methylase UbiE
MYERLANFLVRNINFQKVSVILEAGCGSGELTIPFAKNVMAIFEEFKIIALDVSAGPYKRNLETLKKRIKKEGLEKFVKPFKGDVRNMEAIDNESVDLIISNEFFCDLDREGLEKTLKEFYRILKHNGQMAHGELNPVLENIAQRLVIEADSYSMRTLTQKYEWFSPFSDEVAALMHKIGFKDITVKYFETNVRLPFKEALKQFKAWNINPTFIEKRMEELKKYGIEFPMEHIIFCKK